MAVGKIQKVQKNGCLSQILLLSMLHFPNHPSSMALAKEAFPTPNHLCHMSFKEEHKSSNKLPLTFRDYLKWGGKLCLGSPSLGGLTSTDRQREEKGLIFSTASHMDCIWWVVLTLELSMRSSEVGRGVHTKPWPLSKPNPTPPDPKPLLIQEFLQINHLHPNLFFSETSSQWNQAARVVKIM